MIRALSKPLLASALVLCTALPLAPPVAAEIATASITLGRDPEPPACILNPDGTVSIFWTIEHSTTPDRVEYFLQDPTRTTNLERITFNDPLADGITHNRAWQVPGGSVDGKYWIRVEYWSLESGNEANAEVAFNVCEEKGEIKEFKFEDLNCDKQLDPNDPPVEGYFLCIENAAGEQFCRQTDANGQVCWTDLPVGDYTAYETTSPEWVPASATSVNVTVTPNGTETVNFLNQRLSTCYGACCHGNGTCENTKPEGCTAANEFFAGIGTDCSRINCAVPIEKVSWGQIKATYRTE